MREAGGVDVPRRGPQTSGMKCPVAPRLAGLVLCLLTLGPGQIVAPAAAAPVTVASIQTATNAAEAWRLVEQESSREPAQAPQTEADIRAHLTDQVARLGSLATALQAKFGGTPEASRAELLLMQLQTANRQLDLPALPESEVDARLQALRDDLKAPPEVRASASVMQLMNGVEAATAGGAPLEAWRQRVASHLKTFPAFEGNGLVRFAEADVVGETDPAGAEKLLRAVAAGSDKRMAARAEQKLKSLQQAAELKSKPLDLKFTAVDGREVDLAKLRGKVVLLDFWATWCGPCMAELPEVIKTHEKFRDKGFEIVGISFDQDRTKLKEVTADRKMTWPQYFDGKGWENDLGARFGITSIPTMWLVDKTGHVVDTEARENLAEKVGKLLGP